MGGTGDGGLPPYLPIQSSRTPKVPTPEKRKGAQSLPSPSPQGRNRQPRREGLETSQRSPIGQKIGFGQSGSETG